MSDPKKKKLEFEVLPEGVLKHCWFTKLDSYKKYSCTLALPKGRPDVVAWMAKMKAKADIALAMKLKELEGKVPPEKLKTLAVVYPFQDEVGPAPTFEKTGNIIVKCRSERAPTVIDHAKEILMANVFGGSEGKVRVTYNEYFTPDKFTVGISMWLDAVQVLKMSQGNFSKTDGFTKVDAPAAPPSAPGDGGATPPNF